jgi:hypothetical protein
MKNEKLIQYAQNVEYKVVLTEYDMWDEYKFDYCTYPFKLLFEQGCWLVDNFSKVNKFSELKEWWTKAYTEIERMKTLEHNMKPDQLDMQMKLLADLGACILQLKIDKELFQS